MGEKQVVFVTNSILGGGAESSAVSVFEELLSQGYNIKLIAINSSEEQLVEKSESVFLLNRVWKSGVVETIKIFFQFSRMMNELNPEIVVAHCELPELFCSLMPKSRTQVYVVEHTSNPWAGRKLLGRFARRILRLRKARWVTVIKGQNLIWCGGVEPVFISNPVTMNKNFSSTKISEKIVFIGRLREEKRPEWAIRAALNSSLPIGVIGDGDDKQKLINRYSKYSEFVSFYGFIDNPWSRLSPDTLVVMPSRYEGDGLVAVEALVNGFPIVLALNEDLKRFELPTGNYFLDENELTKILKRVAREGVNSLRTPKDIIEKLRNERSIKVISAKWVKVLGLDERYL